MNRECATGILVDLSLNATPPQPILVDVSTPLSCRVESPSSDGLSRSVGRWRCSSRVSCRGDSEDSIDSASAMKLIDDEEFDFDLPLSPENSIREKKVVSADDDDEIFFGPVGHTEKCVAVAVREERVEARKYKPLSPLSAQQMAELCKEANTIACRIELANAKVTALISSPPHLDFSPPPVLSPIEDRYGCLSKMAAKPAENLRSDSSITGKSDGGRAKSVGGRRSLSKAGPAAGQTRAPSNRISVGSKSSLPFTKPDVKKSPVHKKSLTSRRSVDPSKSPLTKKKKVPTATLR